MTEPTTVSAIVLAAGSASRMGSQKQLLRLGSKTLLEHTLANLRASSRVHEIVVVLGAGADEIRPLVASGEKIVLNPAFREGMGTSLQCGLRALAAPAGAVLVVLADQPLVKPATLDRMVADYFTHQPQILIPMYRGFRGNPVLLDPSVFAEIAALNGDMGCRALFGDHLDNIRKIDVDDAGVLLDVDQPADLALLEKVYANGGRFELPLIETAESILPASPDVVVVGREGVAGAIPQFLRLLNYRVTVVDPLLTFQDVPPATTILRSLDFSLLPPTARRLCVVASMGRFDEEAIEQALRVDISYVALVANKKRSQEVLQSLALRGIPPEQRARVKTKPGLSIGAQTPPEIALSIVAEIVSAVAGGSPFRSADDISPILSTT